MKNLFVLLLAAFVLLFASCSKSYTCYCIVTDTVTHDTVINYSNDYGHILKKVAEEKCTKEKDDFLVGNNDPHCHL